MKGHPFFTVPDQLAVADDDITGSREDEIPDGEEEIPKPWNLAVSYLS